MMWEPSYRLCLLHYLNTIWSFECRAYVIICWWRIITRREWYSFCCTKCTRSWRFPLQKTRVCVKITMTNSFVNGINLPAKSTFLGHTPRKLWNRIICTTICDLRMITCLNETSFKTWNSWCLTHFILF